MMVISKEDYKFLKNHTRTFVQQFLNTLKHFNFELTLESILNQDYFEEFIDIMVNHMVYSQFSLPESPQDPEGIHMILTNYALQKNLIRGEYDEEGSIVVSKEVNQSLTKMTITYWYIHKFIVMMTANELKFKYVIKPLEEKMKKMQRDMDSEIEFAPELMQDESKFFEQMGKIFRTYFISLFKGLRVQSFIDAFNHSLFETFNDFKIILPTDIEKNEFDDKKINFSFEISNLRAHNHVVQRQREERQDYLRSLGVTDTPPRKKKFGFF